MDAAAKAPEAGRGIVRGPLIWHLYLLLGFFQYVLTLQGNIFPFLKVELDVSYRVIGFHSSAFALGILLVGIFMPVVVRRFGRRRVIIASVSTYAVGAVVLCLAPAAPVSIASFFLMGITGIPALVFASLAECAGEKRAIAFNESNAVASGHGIAAPLIAGLCIFVGLGWRGATLIGVAYGVAVLASYVRYDTPEASVVQATSGGFLPPAYWLYWAALAFGVAAEFCIFLWAPTFLESVVGLSAASAASAAAAFAVAMFVGRVIGSGLVRFVAVPRLYVATVAVVLVGFILYWGVGTVAVAVAGLFVVGLGISQMFPLCLGQAIGSAGPERDKASARLALAAGAAILIMPAALGELAGRVGLHTAHLIVPALALAALAAFALGRFLERRTLSA